MDKQIHCLASEIVKQLFFGILLHCMLEQAQKMRRLSAGINSSSKAPAALAN